jgi:hypothetical protein
MSDPELEAGADTHCGASSCEMFCSEASAPQRWLGTQMTAAEQEFKIGIGSCCASNKNSSGSSLARHKNRSGST